MVVTGQNNETRHWEQSVWVLGFFLSSCGEHRPIKLTELHHIIAAEVLAY